jgi:hypothetical protein
LVLPLTTYFEREGILINNEDICDGSLKKESVIIVPKFTAIDASLILGSRFIDSLKEKSFAKLKKELCIKLEC